MANILVVGCGDIGGQLAIHLAQQGHQVYGVRRSACTLAGVLMQQVDVSLPFTLELPALDYLYIILTPHHANADSYQRTYVDSLTHLQHALSLHRLQRVFLVSSTSVYGQDAGEWLDEHSLTQPNTFNGQILLNAEQLCHQVWPTTVLRCGGIYGADRLRLLRWVQAQTPVLTGQWTNRIHAHDVVGILAFLLAQHTQGQPLDDCYVAVDDCPVLQDEVLDWLAARMQLPPVAKVQSAGEGNKRLSNQRLKQLGYTLAYPSYQDGYAWVTNTHRVSL